MSRKASSPARKRPTAASLAALSTAPQVPPRRATSYPNCRAGKRLVVGLLEVPGRQLAPVEPPRRARHALRIGQGVLDRQPHVRRRQLGQHRAVHELDERVDDRFGVDDDLDLLGRQAEQPAGLDHLQGLVHQRGGIDGDLRPHAPGRVAQGLLDGDVRPARPGCVPRKGPPLAVSTMRSTVAGRAALDRLEDGAVLAVDRQEPARRGARPGP